MNPESNLTEHDYELLSAYIDGVLTDSERDKLERRLKSDSVLSRELNGLRQTVGLIKNLPLMKAPRDFTLRLDAAGFTHPASLRTDITQPSTNAELDLDATRPNTPISIAEVTQKHVPYDEVDFGITRPHSAIRMPPETQYPELAPVVRGPWYRVLPALTGLAAAFVMMIGGAVILLSTMEPKVQQPDVEDVQSVAAAPTQQATESILFATNVPTMVPQQVQPLLVPSGNEPIATIPPGAGAGGGGGIPPAGDDGASIEELPPAMAMMAPPESEDLPSEGDEPPAMAMMAPEADSTEEAFSVMAVEADVPDSEETLAVEDSVPALELAMESSPVAETTPDGQPAPKVAQTRLVEADDAATIDERSMTIAAGILLFSGGAVILVFLLWRRLKDTL